VPSKYYREETRELIRQRRELIRQRKAKALMKQRLEDHIAYHIEKNKLETDRLIEEDGKTSIPDNS
jgi:hypothetical protein